MENKNFIKKMINGFSRLPNDVIAFSVYDGENLHDISYPVFANDILSAAKYFKQKNISKQHVALLSPSNYKWLVVFFAALTNENVVITLNPALPADMLNWQLNKSDAEIVFSEDTFAENLVAANLTLPVVSFSELEGYSPIEMSEIKTGAIYDTAVMMFTSGTTGTSKAAELTMRNLQVSVESGYDYYTCKDLDRTTGVLPLYHVAGLIRALDSLYFGKTVCFGRGLAYMMLDIPVFNPTNIAMVPSMVENMSKLLKGTKTPQDRQKYLGNNLKRISVVGAALKQDIIVQMRDYGYSMDNLYGMTETTGLGIWLMLDPEHHKAIGKPYGDMECCIQDGELLLKSEANMKGYYKDPEETAKVIKDGWLYTGDLAYCDSDGYYYLTGRKKNVIILSNGENVNPEEIESVFEECDAIAESMIYSDGKGICADVFTKERDTAAAFIKKYNESMPMYRQVYKVNYSATPLEKTGSGKIKRKVNVS